MFAFEKSDDAVAAIYHAQISGTEEFGGDYTAIVPMLPTGVGTSTPHLTWSDQHFTKGHGTILEISESFRVTDTGYETLANFPRKLFIKE